MSSTQLKLRKLAPERLRSMGLNEAWLQKQIADDSSLLGLGELHLIQREWAQPSGGRIDLLMYDPEGQTRYEIEVMLGAVDESHIIRTIEYWDIERQRYPTLEHRAVIVAEEITSRFFNVIRLLNRAIPIMAIQLSAFRIGDDVVLQFTRVLDTYEFGVEPDEGEVAETVDREYWEKKAKPEYLMVVDSISSLIPQEKGAPRLTYNKFHIALGTSGYNFCWFHPRSTAPHCYLHVKVEADKRQEIIERLEKEGIDADNQGHSSIRLRLSPKDIEDHKGVISELIKGAEEWSQR